MLKRCPKIPGKRVQPNTSKDKGYHPVFLLKVGSTGYGSDKISDYMLIFSQNNFDRLLLLFSSSL